MDTKQLILNSVDNMTRAFDRGDIDAIMRTYECGAVVVGEPGQTVQGDDALRGMFADFIRANARFTFEGHEVLVAGDIALHITPWKMTGGAPDGTAISGQGLSVAVLRRQKDATWLMVIDNPYADNLLRVPVSAAAKEAR